MFLVEHTYINNKVRKDKMKKEREEKGGREINYTRKSINQFSSSFFCRAGGMRRKVPFWLP